MILAVTSENGMVFQHFGHTPEFTLFQVENGIITGMSIEKTGECGHGALAGFLAQRSVDVLICGGIGPGAQNALAEEGIHLVGGVSGSVQEAVSDYLNGDLIVNNDFTCHHHDHDENHSCGDHSCGDHSCGNCKH